MSQDENRPLLCISRVWVCFHVFSQFSGMWIHLHGTDELPFTLHEVLSDISEKSVLIETVLLYKNLPEQNVSVISSGVRVKTTKSTQEYSFCYLVISGREHSEPLWNLPSCLCPATQADHMDFGAKAVISAVPAPPAPPSEQVTSVVRRCNKEGDLSLFLHISLSLSLSFYTRQRSAAWRKRPQIRRLPSPPRNYDPPGKASFHPGRVTVCSVFFISSALVSSESSNLLAHHKTLNRLK